MKYKIRIAVSGIGNRSLPKKVDTSNWHGWIELIKRHGGFDLAAAHDVAPGSLERLVERGYLAREQTYTVLDEMFAGDSYDALLVTSPAEFHAATIEKAVAAGLHCLVEKPFVTDLRDGYRLAGKIEEKGLHVSVTQNWRTKDVGRLLRKSIQEGLIGRVGHIFFRYIRDRENPNYPAYIFEEPYPLLYAMGIHHLDLFRYILGDEYRFVSGSSFKPSWSLYRSDTGLSLYLETKGGVSVTYSGTISSRNTLLPQESLLVEGELGTLANESQWLEPPLWFYPKGGKGRIDLSEGLSVSVADQYNASDIYLLNNFYRSVVDGEHPVCSASDALRSIAAIEAGRIACETGNKVFIDEVMESMK